MILPEKLRNAFDQKSGILQTKELYTLRLSKYDIKKLHNGNEGEL